MHIIIMMMIHVSMITTVYLGFSIDKSRCYTTLGSKKKHQSVRHPARTPRARLNRLQWTVKDDVRVGAKGGGF